MKKKIIIISVVAVLLIALFVPYSVQCYDDGGTKEYSALALKVLKWKKISNDDFGDEEFPETKYYEKTSVYFFPYSTKDLSELWKIESGES